MSTGILTLHLAPVSQAYFETLRRRHFPAERNQVPAHLTLFHQLPLTDATGSLLARTASHQATFTLATTGFRSLGKGVAVTLGSDALLILHRDLSVACQEHLTPQDRQRFEPHIVIQNKVTPAAARSLLQQLEPTFKPIPVHALGLDLWEYLNGPWQHLRTFPFTIPVPDPCTSHASLKADS